MIEPYEVRAVILSMLFFFLLFGSYSIVKPVRDAMGKPVANAETAVVSNGGGAPGGGFLFTKAR